MSLIILKNLTLSYGDRKLFNGINATFDVDQKVGIVGRNGSGKSTLLKVISGYEKLDDGAVIKNPNKTIAYLPQEMVLRSEKNVYDEAFTVFDRFLKMEKELVQIEHKLDAGEGDTDLLERYQIVQDTLAHFDRPQAEQRTKEILKGLGFPEQRFNEPVSTLSVGWKMRLALAKLLLQNADFYLFDEPTNHLDITAKEWFYAFLKSAPFGFLLVTHDRYFLEHACDAIFELSHGNGTMFYGNFNRYVVQKKEQRSMLEATRKRQEREIAQKKATAERFRASASKAKTAQNLFRQIEKIKLVELDPVEPTISLRFPQAERPGKVVLTIDDVSHQFDGKELFKNGSAEIARGKKIAIIAPNGTGKTTLFNLIAGKLPLQNGEIEFGHNVSHALFEQDQTRVLNPNKTVMEEVQEACANIPDEMIRGFLGGFLFSGDDVHKKIKVLSGGEKNRVAMVKVLLQKANFLLLDEPTNHLDLYAKAVLLQALQQYDGTILFVSHDHAFIQDLATDILELTPNGLYYYPGSYEQFLEDKKRREASETQKQPIFQQTERKKKSPKIGQKELKKREREIEKLEKQIEKEYLILASKEYGSAEYQKCMKRIERIKKSVELLYQE